MRNKQFNRPGNTPGECIFRICRLVLFLCVALTSLAEAMNSDEKLLFANGLYRRGLYELAIPEYQMLLTNETAVSMHDLAAFRLGECYRSLNRRAEAAAAYDQVMAQFPDSSFLPRAAFRRAELDWQDGRLKDGSIRFEKLIKLNPPDDLKAAALYHLGLCQAGIDQFDRAEKNWRNMLKNHDQSPYADYARLALADLLERESGNATEISGLYTKVMDDPETPALGAEATAKAGLLAYRSRDMSKVVDLFSELAKKYPGDEWNMRVRLEFSWASLLDGKTDKARSLARAGLADAPAPSRPSWLYLLANIERTASSFADAKKYYDELLASFPRHESAAAAAYEACSLAFQQAEFARVLELADRAAADREKVLPVLWMKAGALKELDRTAEAAGEYARIVQDYPDSDRAPASAYQLALFDAQKNDSAAAARAFEAIGSTYKDSPVASDAWMAAASMYMRDGQPGNAIAAWQKLIQHDPDYARLDEARMGLARAEMDAGNSAEAAGTLQALITDHPGSRYLAEAFYLRGTLYENDRQYEEAEFHYLRAIGLKPAPSLVRQIQHRRVAVLQRQGRNKDAAALMNKLLEEGEASQLPSPLLEWLARWNLENKNPARAEVAALRLAETGETAAWKQVGSFIAGIAALEQKQSNKAEEAFKAAAAYELNTRETAESYLQLGDLSMERKKPEEAIDYYSKASERASADSVMDIRARGYLSLGRAYESMENWAEAARYYLSGGVLFDDPVLTPESLYRAAGVLDAQLKTNDRARVVAELQTRFPESEWLSRARERWHAKP